MTSLPDALTQALRSAPELNTAPSLTLGVAQDAAANGADPVASAQAVAHTVNLNAQQQAVDGTAAKVGHPNLLHQTLGFLGGAVAKVASLPGVSQAVQGAGKVVQGAGVPLREVQHDYRYLHDVEARHGPIAALLEGLGVAGGAAVGAYVGSYQGAQLGGEATAALEGRLFYRDSFARTTDGADYQGTYDRQTGEYTGPKGQVSVGRDVANALGLRPGTKPFSFSSAAIDGLADLTLDPLVAAGGLAGSARGVEGAGGVIGTTFSRAAQGSTAEMRAIDLETRVAKLGSVDRAFREMAGMNAGEIVNNYPKFAGLADHLGQADTVDKVVDVFRDNLMAKEMTTNLLPSMSFTRVPFAKVSRAIQYADIPGQNMIRSVTSYLPTYFDKATLDLTNKGFNTGDPEAIKGVYRVMRFTQSRRVAEAVATDFANAMDDPGKQILIYKNGLRHMLVAAGLPEDSAFVTGSVDEMAQRAMGGGDAVYGVDQAGRGLSKVPTEAGSSSLGILASQQGKLAFPNFDAVTREARSLNAAKNFYGAADDWMYNHFTMGVFKRLVLLSGGFAQRIAAAEAIPAALRQGVSDMIRSRLSASAARGLGEEELGSLSGAVAKVMGGADRVIGDADKTEFVANLMHDNGGHIVAPAIDTTTPSAEVGSGIERANRTIYNAYGQVPERMRMGDMFGMFGHDYEHYVDAWGRSLSQISNDPASQKAAAAYLDAMRTGSTADEATQAGAAAAKAYWDAQPQQVLNRYGRHFATPPGAEGVDPHQLWGEAIMENVKGATHAPAEMDGVPHVNLLKNIGDGTQTPFDTLNAIPEELRPVHVIGRSLLPDTTGTIERVANVGFRKVLDPIINFISREPLYVNEAYRQYSYLKPMVESGDMLPEEARQLAQVRAVNGVLPFIHNTLERSQFSQLARNFMPFWFAQEQAYKRFGRIFADNPGAFRQFQLMTSGLHEVGSTHTDPNGQTFLTYPGAGFLDNGAVKLLSGVGVPTVGSVPVSFSGQLKSLNTVFPFSEGVRPAFGPVVSIPSHLIENLFPELTPAVHTLIGDAAASGSIYDQLIPNQTVKGVVQALDPGMRSRSMQNAVMNTVQHLAYKQQVAMQKWVDDGHSADDVNAPRIPGASPDDPVFERQQLIDHIKNQTRITFLFKAALGSVTPAAPVTNVGDWGLRAEVRDLIKAKGISAAHDEFLTKHPNADAYTVFSSESSAGAPLPANVAGQDWINSNLDVLRKYPNAGAWFVPQTTGDFNQGVYNEQMAQHLRQHKAPDQVLTDIYVAAGNDQFYNRDLPAYKAKLAAAQDTGDKAAEKQVRSDWSTYVSTVLGPQNPVWWDNLNSADRGHNRQLAVQQMQQMAGNNDLPVSPQSADIKGVLDDFASYQRQIGAAKQDSYSTVNRTQLKERWQAYLTRLMADKPNLQPVIRSIFMEL